MFKCYNLPFLPSSGGTDKFRIKIGDKGIGSIVYDNKMGASDTGDDATELVYKVPLFLYEIMIDSSEQEAILCPKEVACPTLFQF